MRIFRSAFPLLVWLVLGLARAAGPEFALQVVHTEKPEPMTVLDPSRLARLPANKAEGPVRLVPNVFPPQEAFSTTAPPPRLWPLPVGPLTRVVDSSTDASPLATGIGFPAVDIRFDAPFDGGVAPPDPVMAAGRDHVVTLVNSRVGIYSKSGVLLQGPFSMSDFFGIPSGFSNFDPLAIYDPYSDRFIVAVLGDNGSAKDARIFVAFSQTAEATGLWNRYWINADAGQPNNWADYGSIGLDRFAVYFSANLFTRGGGFSNVTLFIYDKEDGYAGRPLSHTHLIDVRTQGGGSPFRLRPAFVGEAVPGGAFYLGQTETYVGSEINIFRLTGYRFSSPSLTAFSVPTPGLFFQPGKARQPGNGEGVDSLGANLWNLYYRQGKLWTAQAVSGNGSVAWVHRIDVSGDSPVREQTYQVEASGRDIFFPYVVPDVEDNDFLLLSAFSGKDLYVTGHYWNVSAAGTIRAGENLATGTVRNESGRHGDYFSIGADPQDPNRLWMIAQYMSSSTFSGNSRIASVRFEDVPPPSSPPPVPDGKIVAGAPLRVLPAASGEVTVIWDVSRCPASGHHLVWYDMSRISSYTIAAVTCGAGVSGSWTGVSPGGSVGVIAVSDDNETTEGSHGFNSLGQERPSTVAACGITQKQTSGTCP